MISFTFKQTRFETMHSKAIMWPSSKFRYIGVDPPASTGFDLESARAGESQNAAKPFEGDPYGCHTSLLQEKRRLRYVQKYLCFVCFDVVNLMTNPITLFLH